MNATCQMLLVDECEDTRTVLGALFSSVGAQVKTASNGKEALQQFEASMMVVLQLIEVVAPAARLRKGLVLR